MKDEHLASRKVLGLYGNKSTETLVNEREVQNASTRVRVKL